MGGDAIINEMLSFMIPEDLGIEFN